jgi:hypothetical protein
MKLTWGRREDLLWIEEKFLEIYRPGSFRFGCKKWEYDGYPRWEIQIGPVLFRCGEDGYWPQGEK